MLFRSHVGNLTFHDGSLVEKHLLEDVMKSIKPWLGVLMDNYRVNTHTHTHTHTHGQGLTSDACLLGMDCVIQSCYITKLK